MIRKFNIIVAVGKNNGIGFRNKIPWKCSDDLKFFREVTKDSVLIVGRKTYETLPGSTDEQGNFIAELKGRHLLMVSNSALSFQEALRIASTNFDIPIFVIGGESIYSQALSSEWVKYIDRLYLSKIKDNSETDRFFRYNPSEWVVESKTEYPTFDQYTLKYDPNGENEYLKILKRILETGTERETRNAVTKSLFFDNMSFDLYANTLPLLTTKKMFFRGIVEELLFFLRGDTDSKLLEAKGVNIWKPNTSREFLDSHHFETRREGLMGPMYGFQWRHFGADYNDKACITDTDNPKSVDQLSKLVNDIKTDPMSRRLLITSFNPLQADQGVLYPCHSIVLQFYVRKSENLDLSKGLGYLDLSKGLGRYLDLVCYNRSQDFFLGTPFNIASTALLLMIVAKMCNLEPGKLHISMGDIHIYKDHYDAVRTQLENFRYPFPKVEIPDITLENLSTIQSSDFRLTGYQSNPAIKAEMVA